MEKIICEEKMHLFFSNQNRLDRRRRRLSLVEIDKKKTIATICYSKKTASAGKKYSPDMREHDANDANDAKILSFIPSMSSLLLLLIFYVKRGI